MEKERIDSKEKAWKGTTFGNGLMHRWLVAYLRHVNPCWLYVFESIFIVPVCLVWNHKATACIYRYFRFRLKYGVFRSVWATFANHCLFGQVIVDKFSMYAGRRFEVDVEGYDLFRKLSEDSSSFVMLSAHIGNYELAGYSLTADTKPLNALVFSGEKSTVMENRNKLFSQKGIRMIPVREDGGHVFEINNAMLKGEAVSLPADRVFGSSKVIETMVLGAKAKLPYGPFSLATMRGLDVVAVNVMKSGLGKYKIFVRKLNYAQAGSRKEQVRCLADAYVSEIERIISMYPKQWFNYYDFWQ